MERWLKSDRRSWRLPRIGAVSHNKSRLLATVVAALVGLGAGWLAGKSLNDSLSVQIQPVTDHPIEKTDDEAAGADTGGEPTVLDADPRREALRQEMRQEMGQEEETRLPGDSDSKLVKKFLKRFERESRHREGRDDDERGRRRHGGHGRH